ncbi:hypothetical protein YC2023_097042 [Brassica napus]
MNEISSTIGLDWIGFNYKQTNTLLCLLSKKSPPCPFGRPTEWAPYATVDLVFPALRFSRSGRSVLVTAVAPFSGERSAFVTAVAPYSGERAALVILEGGGSFCSGCLWVVSRCRFEASMGSYPFE